MQFAAGWLGWTQETTLNTDVNFLLAAVEGRVDMLRSIFGSPEAEKKSPGPSKQDFKHLVHVNNALMRKGKIRKARKV